MVGRTVTLKDQDDSAKPDTIESDQVKGRPRNLRVPYNDSVAKQGRCRVVRTSGHETMPRFVGRWFPRNNNADEEEFYCASMLALLKPWRELEDLKMPTDTFTTTFQSFKENLTIFESNLLENIQYYHQCWDAANQRKAEQREGENVPIFRYEQNEQAYEFDVSIFDNDVGSNSEDDDRSYSDEEYEINNLDEAIKYARSNQIPTRDRLFADSAIRTALQANVFRNETRTYGISAETSASMASVAKFEDLQLFIKWEKKLTEISRKEMETKGFVDFSTIKNGHSTRKLRPSIHLINDEENETQKNASNGREKQKTKKQRLQLSLLNEEQKLAHDIIEQQIFNKASVTDNSQLLMIVNGAGGTGKSTLISAITETFEFHNESSSLAKTATSGVAAVQIGGCTLHSWSGIGIKRHQSDEWIEKGSEKTKKKRQSNIIGKSTLIIDEMSMMFDTLLADVSKVVTHTKRKGSDGLDNLPFGGMNVILLGDFHQFPPVANQKGALYSREPTTNPNRLFGRILYQQFDTVVTLKKQMRIEDEKWLQILSRLSLGQCNDEDVAEVRKLIITNNECPKTDFSCAPWNEASLITTRHAVRDAWNSECIKKHCDKEKKIRYIVPAADTLKKGEHLSNNLQIQIAALNGRKTGGLNDQIEIAIGMKAMILLNLATDAELANGSRGTIQDIILDPREESHHIDENGTITLKYPPSMIIFKPDNMEDISTLFPETYSESQKHLPRNTVPLTPSTRSFTIKSNNGEIYTIYRQQYALTAAYAFTDIKSQGQTMGTVIVDLASPPSGSISGFNAYVALSRSKGRKTIRLLRDFEDKLFKTPPSIDLELESKRLEELSLKIEAKWSK